MNFEDWTFLTSRWYCWWQPEIPRPTTFWMDRKKTQRKYWDFNCQPQLVNAGFRRFLAKALTQNCWCECINPGQWIFKGGRWTTQRMEMEVGKNTKVNSESLNLLFFATNNFISISACSKSTMYHKKPTWFPWFLGVIYISPIFLGMKTKTFIFQGTRFRCFFFRPPLSATNTWDSSWWQRHLVES